MVCCDTASDASGRRGLLICHLQWGKKHFGKLCISIE